MPAWSVGGTPVPYLLIRLLFKFVLKVFYSSIIIENGDILPSDGVPCILCANHSNSLTDALMMITSVPLSKRKWLRMTAKDTLFGRKTFSSWLIENVGTLPLARARDHQGAKVDNTAVFAKLMDALDKQGDMICLFPEGISHYSPNVAPLKSGVSRLASDVLLRNLSNPDFELTLITCSITYLHRESFRSDVLVRFNPAIKISVRDHKELFAPSIPAEGLAQDKPDGIRALTALMQEQIRDGTLDAPDFGIIRAANTARRLYAPLGTNMTLADHVQLTQSFVDALAKRERMAGRTPAEALKTPLPIGTSGTSTALDVKAAEVGGIAVERHPAPSEPGYFDMPKERSSGPSVSDEEIAKLASDLHAYQDTLKDLGLKDDRIRRPRTRRAYLLKRLFVRLAGAIMLMALAFPGLVLWLPVFATASFYGRRMRASGRLEDVADEIAHTKLIYGLLSGVTVWALCTLLTFPLSGVTFFLVPALMWLSLRWMEDALSSARAAIALLSLLTLGPRRLAELRAVRQELHARVMQLAVGRAGLPENPEEAFDRRRKKGVTERGGRVGRLGYFSVRRRKKKDYNEIMRLYDQTEFPK